ncbi:hypothetical protein [Fictibacillus enclensis]|uniref:hypothetical protein n=1 Tax=Fictibacillus enclensis TaxID=1017270 RepID=UPI0024BFE287|nr:hypothetical protein [Fictibacillus enclensis]WHY71917.1 hypothetical protein QNH15_23485 [Fictibacillus enclensis]
MVKGFKRLFKNKKMKTTTLMITMKVTVENGIITVPNSAGIGYEPSLEKINKYTTYSQTYSSNEIAAV